MSRATSGKVVPTSKISEWRGLDHIAQVVHGMGCIWREQEKDDIGIDGEIELCSPREDGDGLIGTGKIIKVQSKSGSSYVIRDSESSFATPVSEKDLKYWSGLNMPVIFIVYHPDDNRLYWKDIKTYLDKNQDALTPPHRVIFDKSLDQFNDNAYAALLELCQAAPDRVSMEAGETLYTNLLEVLALPEAVWITPVLPEKKPRFHDRLTGAIPPYVFKGGMLITLADPTVRETAFTHVIDSGATEEILLEDWLEQDTQAENDLRALLNSLLHRHFRKIGLDYQDRPRKYFFNKGLAEDAPLSRQWTSSRTGRTQPRLVAKYYEYGKNKFYRHVALNARFELFRESWAVALYPQLHFTINGKKPWVSDAAKSYAIRARAEEYNDRYLNNILFWVHQLAEGKNFLDLEIDNILVAQVSGIPLTVEAAFSIASGSSPRKQSRK